jgi:A/G-specific adenine glycosylase
MGIILIWAAVLVASAVTLAAVVGAGPVGGAEILDALGRATGIVGLVMLLLAAALSARGDEIAFELDDAVVDVNAARVLARAVAGRSLTGREVQRLADEQLPAGDAWLWNQSVLELGATLCRKRVAQCSVCPVAPHCAWHGEGPDPAAGSAGTGGRQSRFEGSDRQGRGRLLDALRVDDLPAIDADAVTGWADHDRTARIVDGLVADGLVVRDGSQLTLPT